MTPLRSGNRDARSSSRRWMALFMVYLRWLCQAWRGRIANVRATGENSVKRRPSEELKEFMQDAMKQVSLDGVRDAADRAVASIAWMHGYVRHIEEAIRAGDDETFLDGEKELKFAKSELAALHHIYSEMMRLLGR